jgi:hypothetical protein
MLHVRAWTASRRCRQMAWTAPENNNPTSSGPPANIDNGIADRMYRNNPPAIGAKDKNFADFSMKEG